MSRLADTATSSTKRLGGASYTGPPPRPRRPVGGSRPVGGPSGGGGAKVRGPGEDLLGPRPGRVTAQFRFGARRRLRRKYTKDRLDFCGGKG